jgi:Na+-driven multidrug efflux pump
MLRQIIKYGLPTGVQYSVIAFANVLVQANINSFGADAMAACGSYFKIESFVFVPITSFSMALTTFVGQNLGAREYERAREGARFGTFATVGLAELIGITMFLAAPVLIGLFSSDPDVIAIGVTAVPHGNPVLLSAGLFTLHRGSVPRRRKGRGAHDRDAGRLVRVPHRLHHRDDAFYP